MSQPLTETTNKSRTIIFADVAHQYLSFDSNDSASKLVLDLIDTRWAQRLRSIRQTGNTNLVYMFAEHSRFGHSLGVAYLALMLMKKLAIFAPEEVRKYEHAVAAAALLHDIGHVAPGSHIAERVWANIGSPRHEQLTIRIVKEDSEINTILSKIDPSLSDLVCKILANNSVIPPWTRSIIMGGGWNADRGNWAIVDSAMCSVSYGRYNVLALLDAFRISAAGDLVLLESRLDALTHFFVARDSMYRQVYQHRVLQSADALIQNIIVRLRDIISESNSITSAAKYLASQNIFSDNIMVEVLFAKNYATDLPLETVFCMTENWWKYHVERWCNCEDTILKDLAIRIRDRVLFKTVRIENSKHPVQSEQEILSKANAIAKDCGLDPRYYVTLVDSTDKHRKDEEISLVLKENGEILPVSAVEPMIAQLIKRPESSKRWLVVPKIIKEKLGRAR
jgi:HD superfamily phosphohydrolase